MPAKAQDLGQHSCLFIQLDQSDIRLQWTDPVQRLVWLLLPINESIGIFELASVSARAVINSQVQQPFTSVAHRLFYL